MVLGGAVALLSNSFNLVASLQCWQLLLEEFAPEIVYIEGIHNLVAEAISQLDYNPEVNPTSKFNYSTFGVPVKGETIVNWKTFSKLWRCYNKNNPGNEMQECNLNEVFANRSKEEEIFPPTTPECTKGQQQTQALHQAQCSTRQRTGGQFC